MRQWRRGCWNGRNGGFKGGLSYYNSPENNGRIKPLWSTLYYERGKVEWEWEGNYVNEYAVLNEQQKHIMASPSR